LKCKCGDYFNVDNFARDSWQHSTWKPDLLRQIYEDGYKKGARDAEWAVTRKMRADQEVE